MGARRITVVSAHLSLLASALFVAGTIVIAQGRMSKEAEAGWQALQAGDGDRAATIFYDGLTRHPQDPVLHLGAGAAAHLLGRDIDAIASLRRALDLEARLTAASELLGLLLYQQGEVDEAIRVYEKALVYAPGTRSLGQRLADWKKESSVHEGLTERADGRFSIIFDGQRDEALATRAVKVLDAAFWRIGQTIGAYPSARVLVTLYTEQQFYDITRAPAWAGGRFDGKIRVPVRGAAQNLQSFDRVLAHELTHAMIYSLAPRGVPTWVHEGLASYFEPRDPASAERRIRSLGVVVPLSELQKPFSGFSQTQAVAAYEESLVAADLLLRVTGTQTGILFQRIGAGQSFDASLERFGISASELEAQLDARLKRP